MNITTLRTDTRYQISRQLTSSEYSDSEIDRNLNLWYQRVLGWIIPIQGNWEIQGNILTRDFKVGVTEYDLPANLISIYKGEALYTTGGNYVPLNLISVQHNQATVEGNMTREIDDVNYPSAELYANYIQIRPAPAATVTNGLKLWAQIAFTDLDETTNTIPYLVEPVRRVLSKGAALDFAEGEGMEKKADALRRDIFGNPRVRDDKGLKGEIVDIYSVRNNLQRGQLGMRVSAFN